ncbi:hypothetical protein SAMN04488168_13655 [Bacillus sp. 491mf]|nr:hypothetical protein SAMN04488168_13655 [Bacillus sp. 491mf]
MYQLGGKMAQGIDNSLAFFKGPGPAGDIALVGKQGGPGKVTEWVNKYHAESSKFMNDKIQGIEASLARGTGDVGEKASGANLPKSYLYEALKQQGLDEVPKNLKQKWTKDGYNYEVRVHPGNSAHTDAESIYRVSKKATPVPGKQGSGMEYMDVDGNWWHESVLKEFHKGGTPNPDFNHKAAKDTHIPVDK